MDVGRREVDINGPDASLRTPLRPVTDILKRIPVWCTQTLLYHERIVWGPLRADPVLDPDTPDLCVQDKKTQRDRKHTEGVKEDA